MLWGHWKVCKYLMVNFHIWEASAAFEMYLTCFVKNCCGFATDPERLIFGVNFSLVIVGWLRRFSFSSSYLYSPVKHLDIFFHILWPQIRNKGQQKLTMKKMVICKERMVCGKNASVVRLSTGVCQRVVCSGSDLYRRIFTHPVQVSRSLTVLDVENCIWVNK